MVRHPVGPFLYAKTCILDIGIVSRKSTIKPKSTLRCVRRRHSGVWRGHPAKCLGDGDFFVSDIPVILATC